jgi:hypothetical protein
VQRDRIELPGNFTMTVNAEKRLGAVDVRLGRKFQIRTHDLQGQFDIFNLLNSSSILTVTQTFGPSLDRPTGSSTAGCSRSARTQMNF